MNKEINLKVKSPNFLAMLIVFSMPNTLIASLTPGLIQLGHYFNISSTSQLYYVTTLAILGYSIGPLVAPLIAAYYARKGVILAGMILVIIGICGNIVFSAFLTDYNLFLTFRFISGIGAGIALTAIPAMIHDYYNDTQAKKKLFNLTGIYCLWPGIILILCSILTYYLSWEYIVYFLLFYGIVGLIAWFVLPETDPVKIKPENIFSIYVRSCMAQLVNFEFILYCLMGSMAGILMYFFVAEAPFIIIKKLHYSSSEYGYFVMLPYLLSFFSLMLGNIFSKQLTYRKCLLISLTTLLVCSFAMLYSFLSGAINIFTFVGLSTIVLGVFSLIMGYSMTNAVKVSSYKVGKCNNIN